ncbi:hypothetical protein C6558_10950 [Ensifer sp. NM-2]|nr:hypothetical protein C6558_10950 [Ensifer sp. NM-2]
MNYCAPDFGGRDHFARVVTPHDNPAIDIASMQARAALRRTIFRGAQGCAETLKGDIEWH